jgi:hypothetical protein
MIGTTDVIKTLIVAATVISALTYPAYGQAFGKKGGGYAGPPVETHPKVDEKAYKAALDRIPAPARQYDPWGIARPSDPAAAGKKSDQEHARETR